MDEEGPRRAFVDMARQVNELAAKAAASQNPDAPPPAMKTADDVRDYEINTNEHRFSWHIIVSVFNTYFSLLCQDRFSHLIPSDKFFHSFFNTVLLIFCLHVFFFYIILVVQPALWCQLNGKV